MHAELGEETSCKSANWRRRWEGKMKSDFTEIGYGDGRWVGFV
jgi:hypothetical protein